MQLLRAEHLRKWAGLALKEIVCCPHPLHSAALAEHEVAAAANVSFEIGNRREGVSRLSAERDDELVARESGAVSATISIDPASACNGR